MTTNPSSRKTLNLLQNPSVSLLVHDWVSHRAPTATLPSTSSHRHQRPASPPSPSSPSEVSPNTNGAPLSPQHPSTTTTTGGGGGGGPHRSSLANLLLNLNSSSLSSISATINGTAELVEPGTRQEAWLKQRHLENHMLPEGGMGEEGDGGRGCFIEGEEVRVVVVGIRDGRIADWKGGVRDWVITGVGDGR
ncbi:MAG: hypothetical protein M1820_006312 [Bogoriella megaspora]|nr:MAG: hypothetical protein M1820_006312 [Bogoriella megaspora]